jgi:hypothetical protein
MKPCREYISRKPSFSEEATALRKKAERYSELAETIASGNLHNEICACIVDLKALAVILERIHSGGSAEPCISCGREECPARNAAPMKPTQLD